MSNPVIGFIGLGIMGKPMARNLLKAGYTLVVHNRSRAAVDELAKEGAQAAADSQEVAQRSEIIITMLPDSPDVELVYAGDQGIFSGVKSGPLLIDMSSISPVVARKARGRSRKARLRYARRAGERRRSRRHRQYAVDHDWWQKLSGGKSDADLSSAG
jgi:3-hydroxyisobutyrate dehydrogenase and related beta-hydroxyacid dehydrogenases